MSDQFHLAQFNVAWPVAPVTDPVFQEFVNNIERVNRAAENFDGFVWMYQDTNGLGAPVPGFGNELVVVNMSVWETPAALKQYVYSGRHGEAFKKRKQWFKKTNQPNNVLWWVAAGHRPDVVEGKARLDQLTTNGPSPQAFDFSQSFAPVSVEAVE